jgi:antitoxin YefM
MSRPPRLEFEGAFWNITSRGNERKDIFWQDGDGLPFLSLLAMAVTRFRWRLPQSHDRRWNILYMLPVHFAMTEITYTQARANLKALLDEAVDSNEPVIIHRREGGDVALIAVAELRGLIETAHLLRSPKNAERLLRALARAQGRKLKPEPLEKLRRELGLDEPERD